MTKKFIIDKEKLKELYVDNGYSATKIAEIYDKSPATIISKIKEHNIKNRDRKYAQINRFIKFPNSHGWKGKKHTIEQKIKWSILRRGKQMGKENPSYKNGGRGMGVTTYKRLRAMSCFMCGIMENLCVHHIDKDRKNNNGSNLMTLCMSCHGKIHHPVKRCYECIKKKIGCIHYNA